MHRDFHTALELCLVVVCLRSIHDVSIIRLHSMPIGLSPYNISEVSLTLSKLRSCVKVEVAVLGSPSLISLTVSVDVKQH